MSSAPVRSMHVVRNWHQLQGFGLATSLGAIGRCQNAVLVRGLRRAAARSRQVRSGPNWSGRHAIGRRRRDSSRLVRSKRNIKERKRPIRCVHGGEVGSAGVHFESCPPFSATRGMRSSFAIRAALAWSSVQSTASRAAGGRHPARVGNGGQGAAAGSTARIQTSIPHGCGHPVLPVDQGAVQAPVAPE